MRRLKLGTGETITLEAPASNIAYFSITLDVNKQRVYWLRYNWVTELTSVISSDYDGEDRKYIATDQKLSRSILGLSDNSIIFIMENDETRILMMNETDSNLFRNITIEKSYYFDLIVFNNKFNHTTGK